MIRSDRFSLVVILGHALTATAAHAKPARCYTTDDGYYACEFQSLDKAGSFTITAPGKPTFTLEVDRPGFAFGLADFGSGRAVALPGMFVRSREDGACWHNPETEVKICAW